MSHRRVYQVVVTGRVGSAIAASFAPLAVHSENGETTISATVAPTAAAALRQSNSSPCAVTAHRTRPFAARAMIDQIG
jgi:hypothetical protein